MRSLVRSLSAFASLLVLAECIIIRSGGSADELATAAIQDSRLTPRGPTFSRVSGGPASYGTFTDGLNGLSGVILSTGKVEDAPAGYQCPQESQNLFDKRVQNQCVPSTAFTSGYRCVDRLSFQLNIESTETVREIRISLIFATGEGFGSPRSNLLFCADI